MSDRRLKVLMSAYACEPNRGSEAEVGWNWAVQAARYHDVVVLTRSSNREAIETEFARQPVPNLSFAYHDLPRWARFWKKGQRGVHLYYLLWQLTGTRVARRLHRAHVFDAGHHVTFVSHRFPSLLAGLPIPFVWGPIGGGERAPLAFYASFGVVNASAQLLRDAANLFARIDPLLRLTARRANAILTATPATRDSLPSSARRRSRVVPAIGQAPLTAAPVMREPGVQLRTLFAGRLIYWKGAHLAIKAIAQTSDATLTLAGDGPSRRGLERLAARLGVSSRVTFVGQVSSAQVQALYERHDVLLFPSLQDSGGLVVLEAMAAALPVVCVNLGGPGLSVTPDTGIAVAPSNPELVVEELATALTALGADPQHRRSMGEAARRRVMEVYAWDQKGELMRTLYAECAGRSEPVFACQTAPEPTQ